MTRSKPIAFIASAVAVPIIALGFAACGGGSSGATAASAPSHTVSGQPATTAHASKPSQQPTTTKAPAPQPPPTTTTQAPAPPAASGIPQNNGGDGDIDNNGGPDDGDGGI